MTIRSADYDAAESKLVNDPIVVKMAIELVGVPREQLAHNDGTPRFSFMQGANEQYRARGGTQGGFIGSVARALLILHKDHTAKQTGSTS
jgi:hypothetical protein